LGLCLLWGQSALAGGFQISEMSARASGMGNAFTAVADDASAAWYNPAGVAFSEGVHLMLGSSAIIAPGTDYTPNAATVSLPGFPPQAATSSKSQTFFVPHAYYTYWDNAANLGASISINAPFGLEIAWSPTSSLASSSTFSKISLVNINPSVIFKLNDYLSVSGGFSYAYLRKINLDNAFQLLEGKNKDGWGGTASVMLRNDQFSFGVTYRSRISIDINGGTVTGGTALGPLAGVSATGGTKMTLPDTVNAGLAWRPDDAWLLSADVDWTNWKTFNEVRINYAPSALATALTAGTNVNVIPQNWKAVFAFRAGVEWRFNPRMRARLGYVFDQTPVQDTTFSPDIPDNDTHLFSAGYSFDFTDSATFDLAYSYIYIINRDQIASTGKNAVRNGRYKTDAHIVAASVQYVFK